MLSKPVLLRLAAVTVSACALLLTSSRPGVAQDNPPCPFATDDVVSPVLGSSVHGYADAGTEPGLDVCEFGDFTMYRRTGAQSAPSAGFLGLAQDEVLALPAEVAAQIGALGAGTTIQLPGYQVSTPTGVGDAALWVKDVSFGVDALVVQRGAEEFVFQVLDRPDAQPTSVALARAVLASASAAQSPAPPSGTRPAVVADCGVHSANAVADVLRRDDVVAINVIGGCHYVAIQTTLAGSGFANASLAQAICDSATGVAYGSGILGITVTDRDNHERASGADGQPCNGFP